MTAVSTEALPLAPARPALRLVPAPVSAPPYDDEPGSAPLRLLSLVPQAPRPVPFDDDAWLAPSRTPSAELPAAAAFARVLLQGLLEVSAGLRPVTQLRRDTTPELYGELSAALAARPGRTAGARPDRRAVRSLHVQERPEGIAEVCATVARGARTIAVALRLEGLDGRWRCTELVGL